MKLSKLNSIIIVSIIFEIFVCSCAKQNPEKIQEWEGQVAPTFIFRTISIPEKMRQSPDSMAQRVVEYVNLTNECTKYRPYLIPPENYSTKTTKGPPWITTWNSPKGYMIFLTIDGEVGGSSFTWEVKFWGTDSTTGVYYHRWIFLKADQAAADKIGGIRVYKENTTNLACYYNWVTFHDEFIYTTSILDGDSISLVLEFHIYHGLAGDLFQTREDYGLEYKFSWNMDGSGEWWRYDQDFNVIDSGSWN